MLINIQVLKTFYFIKYIVNIIFILVPCLIILLSMFTLIKYIISGKNSDLKDSVSIAINRLIIGVSIFFIPTLVNVVVSMIDSFSDGDFSTFYFVNQEMINKEISKQKNNCLAKGNNWLWDERSSSCLENPDRVDNSSQIEANALIELNNNTAKDSEIDDSYNSSSGVSYAKNIKYYNQGDYSNVKFCSGSKSVKSSGCGATSLSMIASTFSSSIYTPKTVANWLCSTIHGGGGMSASAFTNRKMLNKFGLNSVKLFDNGHYQGNSGKTYKSSNGEKILKAVREGKGIILYIPGHYVVVGQNTKCNENQVYLYDPGKRANNGCYSIKQLWSKTYNNKNRCTNNGNCGWKAAWAYTKA